MKNRETNEALSTNDVDGRGADGIAPTEAKKTRSRRFRRRFAAAVALLAALGAILAADSWRRLRRQPIDVENASTGELVGWLALRDLSVESPETREELFEKYFAAISASVAESGEINETGNAGTDDNAEFGEVAQSGENAGVAEKIEFEENGESGDGGRNGKTSGGKAKTIELPENVKRFAGSFLSGRDEKIAEWSATRTRPAYLRLDYVVVPQTPRTSEFVLSGDVRPGPALRERWEKSRAEALENKGKRGKTGGGGKSVVALEQNVKLMIMQWFATRFREYDETPDARKKAKIDRCADELLRLQDFYVDLRVDAASEPSTRADMLREFEATWEGWNEIASVEEVAKALYFKDLLESVLAARETSFGRAANDAYPKRVSVPNADAGTTENSANGAATETTGANVRRAVGDAIKRFVWKDATETEER